MEDTRSASRVGDYEVYSSPCHFLREAVSAILKCLGLDESKPSIVDDAIKNSSSCSKEQDNYNFSTNKEQSCQDDQSSYIASDGQPSPSDSPSTITDPADDPPMVDLERRGRTPTRPGINTGRDPQTNSSSS